MIAIGSTTIWLRGEKYGITNWTSYPWVNPKKCGIKAQYYSTANSDGYYCSFEIREDALLLKDFFTYNSDGEYPPLNNIEPIRPRWKADDCAWLGVDMPIAYTGVLGLVRRES